MDERTQIESQHDASSRRWRILWRFHFYSGILSIPFIVLMALTGLVILYTQPIEDLTQRDLRVVSVGSKAVPYDEQAHAVEEAFPEATVTSMTVGADPKHSTIFAIDDGSASGREVFVDPYTGEVLGSVNAGSGIVRLSNRLHGYLNNPWALRLPTVSALWDGGAVMRDYQVGDMLLEILGVWTLVLVSTGAYIYWPRRSAVGAARNRRGFLRIRWGKGGRARWRDLHGFAGILLIAGMVLTIISGLAWSTYWGPNFTALANEISPNSWTDAPASTLGTRGDLDRLGNTIPWNTGDRPIPASYATKADGSLPAPLSLDDVVRVARREHMKPGFTVNLPTNATDEKSKEVTYGSFTMSNSWPRKTGEARDVFLDQFSGKTLGEQDAYGYGSVSYGLDTLVSTHMGTQLGIANRILMTSVCVLALWSVVSAIAMYSKRRRKGSFGLPRRPENLRLGWGLWTIGALMVVVFPEWGVTALAILGFDHFVIQRTRLRRTFGQR
ncbi:MAG: PepSY-associated TM helix domain-containing protein [Actinomycetes bacterium]